MLDRCFFTEGPHAIGLRQCQFCTEVPWWSSLRSLHREPPRHLYIRRCRLYDRALYQSGNHKAILWRKNIKKAKNQTNCLQSNQIEWMGSLQVWSTHLKRLWGIEECIKAKQSILIRRCIFRLSSKDLFKSSLSLFWQVQRERVVQ